MARLRINSAYRFLRLSAGTVKPTLEVTCPPERQRTYVRPPPSSQIEEEALARTILPDDKPYARTSLLDPLEIIQQSGNFIETTNLEVTQSYPGNNSGS